MEKNLLLTECRNLLNAAEAGMNNSSTAQYSSAMSKLRETLNSQPELEAGGAPEKPDIPEAG